MSWAVVQTQPWEEGRVAERLHRESFTTFLPRLQQRVVYQGRRTKRIAPLFPGYLFVILDGVWYAVQRCAGVIRILMDGETPAAISDDAVAGLQRRADPDGVIILPRQSKFKPGQSVRSEHGAMAGINGLYDGLGGRDRVRVLYEMLGRKVAVELNERDLVAV